MSDFIKVSIITTVYNAKDYLRKCLDSLKSQDIDSYEVILVDDGSTDNSGDICEEYKSNVIKVFHKEDNGAACARNYGVKHATGKYVTFVDSDDAISPNFLSTLYSIAEKYQTDYLVSIVGDYKNPNTVISSNKINSKVISKSECYRKIFMQDEIDTTTGGKLYNRNLFNKIQFHEGYIYDDIELLDSAIENSNRIVMTNFNGYLYNFREGSGMNSKMTNEKLTLINTVDRLVWLMKQKYPENVDAAIRRYVYCNFHLLGRSVLTNGFEKISIEIRNNILQYKKQIFTSNLYNLKEKVATLIVMIGIPLFKKCWVIKNRFSGKLVISKQ